MEYNKVKNANYILSSSNYVVKNAEKYRNKWNDFFGNKNPIDIELGMGRGDFIINMALENPNTNYVGIELNESQTATAAQRVVGKKINNLKFIQMDAADLDKVFGKEIRTIYLTFSEPWPKKIDEKKRFTHINYLKLYDRIFKKDKHIILKTDNKGLFAYSLETLSNYWYVFKKVSLDLHNDERGIHNIMTDFEKKYYEEKRPIYYVDAFFE
ncbi:MAG: tRNA (guanosine(46)-N7)-methyltransferase TrmB [Bacilli bacterium]|nr:tRNA (guanosine(46)-N7)-methyltransferase TrmB [Bacilli bacterium]